MISDQVKMIMVCVLILLSDGVLVQVRGMIRTPYEIVAEDPVFR